MRSLPLVLVAASVLVPGCATTEDGGVDRPEPAAEVAPAPLDIENLVVLEPGLAASGQPTPEQLAHAKELGYRSVVNLRTVKEGADEERLVVQELGMVYANIPIEGSDVTFEDADALAEAISERLRPVLVHCSSGNRTGGLWALYCFRHRGMSVEAALAAGRAAGLKHPRLTKLVERRLRSR